MSQANEKQKLNHTLPLQQSLKFVHSPLPFSFEKDCLYKVYTTEINQLFTSSHQSTTLVQLQFRALREKFIVSENHNERKIFQFPSLSCFEEQGLHSTRINMV
ncbi:hypothetical protein FGO68_gene9951 [Halteria grandinella]|uniref:Uncharacterized protein n=1 Tax=Halteria grandinella TaxID=5974 RepID=A0A8J8NUX8_HALGN|nr:hypothetical protein FGO68_gene9951 [Halteria grandinella]